MPYADKDKRNACANARRQRNRAEFFRNKSCSDCKSTQNLLIRHDDDEVKVSSDIWGWEAARRWPVLRLCYVICRSCAAKNVRHSSKLDADSVLEIRDLIKSGNYSHKEIAQMFNVSDSTISSISCGRIWKHI